MREKQKIILNPGIDRLRERILSFLEVNTRVSVLDLKNHLECSESELLLALGGVISGNNAIVEKEGWELFINKN